MAPQPASHPTALLWAAQLKREHAFLLERIHKVETEMQRVEAAAERNELLRDAVKDVSTVAEQIQEMFDKQSNEAIDTVIRPLTDRVNCLHEDIEALGARVAIIQGKYLDIDDERKRALSEEKGLLKRILRIEEQEKLYKKELKLLKDGMSCLTDQRLQNMDDELQSLHDEIKNERHLRQLLSAKTDTLETAVQKDWIQGSATLRNDIRALAAMQVASPTQATAQHLDTTSSMLQLPTGMLTTQTGKPRGPDYTNRASSSRVNESQQCNKPSPMTRLSVDPISTRLRPRRQLEPKEMPMSYGGKAALPSRKTKPEDQSIVLESNKGHQNDIVVCDQQSRREIGDAKKRRTDSVNVLSSPLSSPPTSLLPSQKPLSNDRALAPKAQEQGLKAQKISRRSPEQIQPLPRRRRRIQQTFELPRMDLS